MRSMSKKESLVEYILKMLFQVLVNFSMGLIMALVVSFSSSYLLDLELDSVVVILVVAADLETGRPLGKYVTHHLHSL